MSRNLENVCRVCLNVGSRNIFEKSSSAADAQGFAIPPVTDGNVSSLDRLAEKLRYVTMLKVSISMYFPIHKLPHTANDMFFGKALLSFSVSHSAEEQQQKKHRKMKLDQGFVVYVCSDCLCFGVYVRSVIMRIAHKGYKCICVHSSNARR